MNNPVLMLTHNCLEKTKRAFESICNQDVHVSCLILDNGSTDGTKDWLRSLKKTGISSASIGSATNDGVSDGWNTGLDGFFFYDQCDHVLVVNNDTVLPPWFYRTLLAYDVPFVTGVSVDNMDAIKEPKNGPLIDHPDFSAFLIRRECWEKVGPFDERMKFYAQDCDYHVRAHQMGVKLWGSDTPFYHERSSTLNLAPPQERMEIEAQANRDRVVFREKWGCVPGEPAYDELFRAIPNSAVLPSAR